jgi:phage anti-repressor protein
MHVEARRLGIKDRCGQLEFVKDIFMISFLEKSHQCRKYKWCIEEENKN